MYARDTKIVYRKDKNLQKRMAGCRKAIRTDWQLIFGSTANSQPSTWDNTNFSKRGEYILDFILSFNLKNFEEIIGLIKK